MKKVNYYEVLIWVFVVALMLTISIPARAQFRIVTTINKVTTVAGEDLKPGEVYEGDVCPGTKRNSINITDKLGIGYQLDDNFIIGLARSGEKIDDEYHYDLFVRYDLDKKFFAILEYQYLHSEDVRTLDYVDLGVGYSFNIFRNLYLEPNYVKSMKEDGKGQFNIAFSYLFSGDK